MKRIKRPNHIGKRFIMMLGVFGVVFVSGGLIYLFGFHNTANADWYDTSYAYRKPIVITNSSGGALTNLQYLLTIDTSTATGIGNHIQGSCQDIRFVTSANQQIPYYIDSGCTTSATKVWVYLSSLPTGSTRIFMYYGNPNAASASSSTKFDNLVSLKGYWTFNEGSGATVNDSSITGATGTFSGGTVWMTGHLSNAGGFNGSNQVNVPDSTANAALRATGTAWTISGWVERTGCPSTCAGGDIVVKGNTGVDGYEFGIGISPGTANNIKFTEYGGADHFFGSFPQDNNWHFIEITKNSTTDTLYIDGSQNATISDTNSFTSSTAAMSIGQGWSGGIDDLHIYNTTRTATQAAADYNTAYTIQTLTPNTVTQAIGTEQVGPQPVLYWKFSEGQGTTVNDSTTDGVTGTLATTGTVKPTWQTADQCIAIYCLYFDGASSYISVAKAINNIESVGMWVRPISVSSGALIDLDGGTHKITVSSGTLSATGFTSPTIYVNGKVSSTLVANQWQYVEVTTGTSFNSTASLTLGKSSTTYFQGFIDEVKAYTYARTASQIANDYTGILEAKGGDLLGAQSSSALNQGLVGYWKMDEASWNGTAGEVKDASGNGNNGTSTNATITTGKYGNGGSFNGTTAYVNAGNPSSLQVTGAITMSAWVKLGATGASQWIMDRAAAGQDNYDLYISSSNVAGLTIGSASCTGNTTLSSGKWYHIVGVYSPSTSMSLYVNGNLDATCTSSIPSSIPNNAQNFHIGNRTDSIFYLNGTIDEARVYNRALSAGEVTQLYNFAPGPSAYYRFDEGTGSSVSDSSGNANTGTWNGTLGNQWTQGKYGKAGNFNGSNNYVKVTTTTGFPTTNMTVEAWVYLNALPASGHYVMVLDQTDGGNDQFYMQVNNGGTITFAPHGNDGSQIISNGTITTKTWYHLVGVRQSGAESIYVNGVKDSVTGTDSATDSFNTCPLLIGSDWPSTCTTGSSNVVNGKIDEVKIYNYARTPGQIIQDMNASHPLGGSPVGSELGWWKFDEGYGTTAHNSGSAGSALNGTLTASPTWTTAGKFGNALTFTGPNYVDLGTASSLQMKNSFSFSTWVNFSSFSSYAGSGDELFFNWATTGYFFGVNPSKQLDFGRSGVAHDILINTSLTTGTWYHIAVTVDGSDNATFYINGKQVGTGTITEPASFSGNLHLSDSTYPLLGTLDETKFYSGTLTAQDILVDYNRASSIQFGTLGNNTNYTNYSVQATNQQYCVPGDNVTACGAPVADWEFEEGSGTTINDVSGNGNTMTIGTGGATFGQGKFGKGLVTPSANATVQAADAASLKPSTITIEAWVNPTTTSLTFQNVIMKGWNNASSWDIYINNSSAVFGLMNSTSTEFDANSASSITANKWNYIVATFDGTTAKIYVNGVLGGTAPTVSGSGFLQNTSPVHLSFDAGNPFGGTMDQVRIFNYARTAAQVAYDYNRGAPQAYWKFDECQGSNMHDSSGNSYNGTWAGGTSVGTCNTSSTAWGNGATGKYNASLNFNGSNDYVSVTNQNFGISSTNHQATVSVWIKPTALSGNTVPIDNISGSQTGGFQIYVNTTGFACLSSDATGYDGPAYTHVALSTGNWYLITCVYNGTSVTGYLNGTSEGSQSITHQIINPTHTTFIGAGDSSGSPANAFNGQIDDVRIYNYPLTSTQTQLLYNQGAAVRFGPATGTP